MDNHTLWMRIGVSVSLTREQLTALYAGRQDAVRALADKIQHHQFTVDGDCYIPDDSWYSLGLPRPFVSEISFDVSETSTK